MPSLLLSTALAVFTAGFLWPVEDAVNGSGLHLVLLWLTLAALTSLTAWRGNHDWFKRCRWQLADTGAVLLFVGHVVSTAMVFREHGDRRSALTMCFESFGLLAQWILLRHFASEFQSAPKIILSVIGSIAIGLAVFGIWQSMVFYPEQSEWYRSRRQILDRAQTETAGVSASDAANALKDLQAENIPTEGTGRILWENRLLSSTEPFGTFSLANTLAGVLALSIVVVLSIVGSQFGEASNRSMWKLAFLLAGALCIAWCLVLTKSRSAWVGACAGILLLFAIRLRSAGSRRLVQVGAVLAIVCCILFGTAAMSGVIDKEVILESPRSLQFRLMYWTGTVRMLQQYPLFGPGPGNFRNAYLQYRADESSEEIRDPHNFLLEAWSSSGLLGLLGVSLIAVSVVRFLAQTEATEQSVSSTGLCAGGHRPGRKSTRLPDNHDANTALLAVLMGFGIHFAWEWLRGRNYGIEDWPQLLLLCGLPLLIFLQRHIPEKAIACGAVALMIHLLAAGGFGMPAVMSLLMATVALCVSRVSNLADQASVVSDLAPNTGQVSFIKACQSLCGHPLLITSTCIIGAMALSQWGLTPVLTSSHSIALADQAVQVRDFEKARTEFQRAAGLDLLSVAPRQHLADLESYRLEEIRTIFRRSTKDQASGGISEEDRIRLRKTVRDRENVVRSALQAFVDADRRSAVALRRQAQGLAALGEILGDQNILNESLSIQQQAVSRFPSSIEMCVELARLCEVIFEAFPADSIRDVSCRTAVRALELESVNRLWGHTDRYLDDAAKTFLEDVVANRKSPR